MRLSEVWLVIACVVATNALVLPPECYAADTLAGGAVSVQTAVRDLRDARLAIGRARKATANLFDEVSREDLSASSKDSLVGSSAMISLTPAFSGKYLPPREKWVSASMAEMAPIMNLLKEDVQLAVETNRHVEASDATTKALQPLRKDAFDSVNNSFQNFKELEQLTAGPSYDNHKIAFAARNLDTQLKVADRKLLSAIQILVREAQSSKK